MRSIFGFVVLSALVGCGAEDEDENTDPEGAKELLAAVQSQDYRTWTRPPGYESRVPSKGPHSQDVDIYVNDTLGAALGQSGLTKWPEGSLIVKDGFKGDELRLIALMEKRDNGWYWAELSGTGSPLYSGKPSLCTDCHRSGDDFVRAFDFP